MSRDEQNQINRLEEMMESMAAKLDALSVKVDEGNQQQQKIRTLMLGVEGQGGLYKWVVVIDERVTNLMNWKHNITGMKVGLVLSWGAITAIIGYLSKQ